MARIRTIKPEFFTHEGLAELSPLQRLFFIGLWTQADREGRLEDRPKRLKVILLPYDDCDIDSLLSDLADKGFIVRYEVDGKALLEIPGFLKHQRPHPKEPSSDLPIPSHKKKRQAVKKNDETMIDPSLREGKGMDKGKGKETPYSPPGDVVRIVSKINELSGKHYTPQSKEISRYLTARLKKGATVEECLLVVEDRWTRWKDKDEMREHFNPVTLFRESKFPRYLEEARFQNGAETIEQRTKRVVQEASGGS